MLKPRPSILFDVPVPGLSWNVMNPFAVLEIPSDASPEDIKAAYHRLAKRWHPDRYTGKEKAEAETRFRELAEAFSMLKDPAKRLNLQQQSQQQSKTQPKAPAGSVQPEAEPAQERTPEDWAAMAKAAFDEGNNDQARALIHYAIRLDDGKPQYHALLAAILEKDGSDLRAVVKSLETAVRLAPRDVESHIRLARHFEALGMAARSQRHLQAAKEISPNHPKLRVPPPKDAKNQTGRGSKTKPPVAPPGLLDQLKDLWGRLTGKG